MNIHGKVAITYLVKATFVLVLEMIKNELFIHF